jgi:hypothetical protein
MFSLHKNIHTHRVFDELTSEAMVRGAEVRESVHTSRLTRNEKEALFFQRSGKQKARMR